MLDNENGVFFGGTVKCRRLPMMPCGDLHLSDWLFGFWRLFEMYTSFGGVETEDRLFGGAGLDRLA